MLIQKQSANEPKIQAENFLKIPQRRQQNYLTHYRDGTFFDYQKNATCFVAALRLRCLEKFVNTFDEATAKRNKW